MANPHADPTSIDYVLQRAQDELRRGENQHCRATEAQYTNHVRELLGNLERYLETCGVQLPSEVITEAEVTTAAAGASLSDTGTPNGGARPPFSSQVRGGFLCSNRSYPNLQNRSLSASAAVESGRVCRGSASSNGAVPHGPFAGDAAHPRVGWGTLATPTEAQQLDCTQEGEGERRPVFANVNAATVLATGRRITSDTASASLTTSFSSNNNTMSTNYAVLPKVRNETSRAACTSEGAQHTPPKLAGSSSPHFLPNGSAADTIPEQEGVSFSTLTGGSLPLIATVDGQGRSVQLRPQQRTPLVEPLDHSSNPQPPEAVIAHARSVSLNIVADGSGAYMGSGTDQWGDFGQFVQSITESRMNSNLTSLQSAAAAAAAAYSMPVGCSTGSGGTILPVMTAPPSQESTMATMRTVGTSSPAMEPETAFQLPHVLVTASSPRLPSMKDLLPSEQQSKQPHDHQQQQQQQVQHGVMSPLSVGSAVVHPESASLQDAFAQSSQQYKTTAAEVVNISSCSSLPPPQAAYGAGSNAVRALAATTTTATVGAEREVKAKSKIVPAVPGDSPHPSFASPSSIEQVPTLQQQCSSSVPSTQTPGPASSPGNASPNAGRPVPFQRAASLPVNANYLPYGKGGNPSYPHILHVCTSATSPIPKTEQNSPPYLLSRPSPEAAVLVSPMQQQQLRGSEAEDSMVVTASPVLPPTRRAEDGEVVARSQEKEQLIRRLRDILSKPTTPAAAPSVTTSLAYMDGPPSPVNGGVAYEAWGVKTPLATVPNGTIVSSPRDEETTEKPPWRHQQHIHPQLLPVVGGTNSRFVTVRSAPTPSSPQAEHLLHAHNLAGYTDDAERGDTHHNAIQQPLSTPYGNNVEAPGATHATSTTYPSVNLNAPCSKDVNRLPTSLCSESRRTLLPHNVSSGGPANATLAPNPSLYQPNRNYSLQQQRSGPPPGPPSCCHTAAYSNAIPTSSSNGVVYVPLNNDSEAPAANGNSQRSSSEVSRDEKQQLMERLRMMLS